MKLSSIIRTLSLALTVDSGLSLSANGSAKPMNRLSFLKTTCATAAAVVTTSSVSNPAFAKEVDPALKGTKADPKYQACLSECMYE